MFKDKANLIILLVAAMGAVGGFMLSRHLDSNSVANPIANAVADEAPTGESAPVIELPDLEGVTRNLTDWQGQAVLINFWATWCAPCRKEMPELVELRETYHEQGLEVLGIAIDDPGPAAAMAEELGVNYPILVADMVQSMPLMNAFGNEAGVLPFTVMIDPAGDVAWVKLGTVTFDELSQKVTPLLP